MSIHTQIQAVQNGAATWRQSSVKDRLKGLRKLRQTLITNENEILQAFAKDYKKPPVEVLLTEIEPVVAEIDFVLTHLRSWVRPQRAVGGLFFWGSTGEIRHQPKGAVLIISPWNFPLNLALAPLVSALACGNTVLLKPSELTPHVSHWIQKTVAEIFPPDQVQVVQGGPEITQLLLQERFAHIFFTGSTRVGQLVLQAASQHLTPVTLELGGKSPTVITASANLSLSAEKVLWGKIMNSGQTCVAPDHVYVHASVVDEWLRIYRALIDKLQNATGTTQSFAQIITPKHAERLHAMVETSPNSNRSMGPHILDLTNDDFRQAWSTYGQLTALREEIFGPVLPVFKYSHENELIAWLQSQETPLAFYLFSDNRKIFESFCQAVPAGTAAWNDLIIQFAHKGLPFGGRGASGMGNCHGLAGLRTFSHEQGVVLQGWGGKLLTFFFPPYQDWQLKILRFYLRYFRGI